MSNTIKLVVFSLLFSLLNINTIDAQIWKRLKKKVEDKIEKKTDKGIDDVLNKKKVKKKKKSGSNSDKNPNNNSTKETDTEINKNPELWRNFKFIPGEKVVFYDDLKFEEVGEFPSRWDLFEGGAEISKLNNENVIIITDKHDNSISPLFETTNYLGDEFTIEFDIYIDNIEDVNDWQNFEIFFSGTIDGYKSLSHRPGDIKISYRKDNVSGFIRTDKQKFNLEEVKFGSKNSWHHISISYYKKKLKVYHDEKRIGNIPNFTSKINGLTLCLDSPKNNDDKKLVTAIKNIRIAHGGGQMYKRIMVDGKYTTNGILFDSGKATIKSQSIGVLNKIVTVMNENPDWNFQIIGHTDNDGTPEKNLILSKQRAEAVKQTLKKLGINENRLSVLGKGEGEPLNQNKTPEEKANNRRVEFVKN